VHFSHLHSPVDSPEIRLAAMMPSGALFLDELLEDAPSDLQQLLERGPAELDRVRALVEVARRSGVSTTPESDYRFAPAVVRPPAVIAIGLNYAEHAEELGLDIHSDPTVFGFYPSSLAAHNGTTTWSRHNTDAVDYEVELGVIIGSAARDVSREDALDYVFGYTVVNDLSARDVQFREQQWIRCKSFDGFTPVGPVVVTADEIADPQQLRLTTDVNGTRLQDSTTAHMIRGVAELVSYLSRGTTLLPGTLIATGTPAGAGYSRTPQVLLHDGDTVTVSIEGIGSLTTHCHTTD
jgi:ureidoglycolate lyase